MQFGTFKIIPKIVHLKFLDQPPLKPPIYFERSIEMKTEEISSQPIYQLFTSTLWVLFAKGTKLILLYNTNMLKQKINIDQT
jgi:hypothetical protein